jgi:hypothetical protein
MPDLLTGGCVDGGGAVIRREVIFRWEPVDRLDFGQNPAGDDRPDTVELGEPGAGAVDQRSDLPTDRTGFLNAIQQFWATPALEVLRGEPSTSSQAGGSEAGPRQGRAARG